jgi:uncharacterized protein with HEPN domain
MRREAAFLADIVSSTDELAATCRGLDRDSFYADTVRWRAALHLLTLIGEAASRLPSDFRDRHPEGEWGKAAGLRNRIVHKYWDLDLEVIWSTLQEDIPKLRAAAAAILEAEYPPDA